MGLDTRESTLGSSMCLCLCPCPVLADNEHCSFYRQKSAKVKRSKKSREIRDEEDKVAGSFAMIFELNGVVEDITRSRGEMPMDDGELSRKLASSVYFQACDSLWRVC